MHETYGKKVRMTYAQARYEGERMVTDNRRCEFVSYARDNRELHKQAKAAAIKDCKQVDRDTGNGAVFRYVVDTEVL